MKRLYLVLCLWTITLTVSAQCWQSTSAGSYHTLAVKPDGTLWAWGFNGDSQLGDGTTTEKLEPTQIGTASDWKQVAAGGNHSLALKTDGTLWAWGYNLWGQVGDGTFGNPKNAPVKIGTSTDWQFISAGKTFSFAIKTNGTLWSWGENIFGQLGRSSVNFSIPQQVGTDTNWKTVAAGGDHTLGIKTDGTLWAWGFNSNGELGDGTATQRSAPTKIGTATDWQSVAAGYDFSLALKSNGALYAWGANSERQLGDGTLVEQHSPLKIGTATWLSIAAGYSSSTALKSDGSLWTWGWIMGGFGADNYNSTPTQLGTSHAWQRISSGDQHALAFQTDGTLWGWGNNDWGKLGDGTMLDRTDPELLSTATPAGDATQTVCGSGTLADLKATGSNISWYATPTGGVALPVTTVLVNGAHYYANATRALCESPLRLDVTVVINTTASPTPTGPAQQDFCGSSTIAALAANGQNIKWYSSASGGQSLDPATGLTDGIHYFATQTIASCESGRLEVVVSVNETPAPTGNPAQALCFTSKLSDIAVTGTGITWYTNQNGAVVLPSSTSLVNGTHYYATQTISSVESCTRLDIQVTLISTPAPLGAAQQTICTSGNVSDLQATGEGSILWYDSPTDGSVVNGDAIVNGQHYYATQYLNGCWSTARLDVTATINSTPRPTGDFNQYFCGGATVADLQAVGTAIKWYDAETGGNVLPSTTLLETNKAYFASQTISGTESCLRFTVGALVRPDAPPDGPATQAFCKQATVSDLETYSGYPITWYATATGNVPLAPTQPLINGAHYFVSHNISGCESKRFDVTVIVNPTPPAAPTGEASQTFCGGTAYDLVATGTSIQWYDAPTGGNYVNSNSLENGKHYYGSQTVLGCESTNRLEVTATVLPVATTPALPNAGWRSISAGTRHNIGIKNDGTLWGWGENRYNQLGKPEAGDQPRLPVVISTDNDWKVAEAGIYHNAGIKTDGTLWVWGAESDRQMSEGSGIANSGITQKGTDNDWKVVSAGYFYTVAIKTDGTLWSWKATQNYTMVNVPIVQVGIDHDWIAISAGSFHTLALKANGTLWAWGANSYGQLGDGTVVDKTVPVQVGTASDWKYIKAGSAYSFAIKANATLWSWGAGTTVLINTPAEKLYPVQVGSATNWKSVASTVYRTTAVKTDGTLWSWLVDYYNPEVPVQMETASDWSSTTSGSGHSLAIKNDGTLWEWGSHVASNGYPTPQLIGSPSVYIQELCTTGVVANINVVGQDVKWYNSAFGGDPIDVGTALANHSTYYATQTIGICESPLRLEVLVMNKVVDAPTGNANQSFCGSATVSNLAATGTAIKWYVASTGGSPLLSTTKLVNGAYYYASQVLNGCESPLRLEVIASLGAPTPGGDIMQAFCTASTIANLTAIGNDIKWYAASTGAATLTISTPLINGTHYFASQTINGCESIERLEVTAVINVVLPPTGNAIQSFCKPSTLSDLIVQGTDVKWYSAATGGAALPPTTTLIHNQSYYSSQTINGCESVSRFLVNVQINAKPAAPVGESSQVLESGSVISMLVVTGSSIQWYHTAQDATSGTNGLSSTESIVNGSTYYATQTISGCESLPLAVTAALITGIEVNDNQLKLYPNPIENMLTISFGDIIDEITIINSVGQRIHSKNVQDTSTSIDFTEFRSGVYFVEIRSGNLVIVRKAMRR